ncbi:MAG: hypothetical protein KDA88_20485 [Planctomycetaceae bacterium]|nr:hypothetical protein [Planctomycetaceae bacterium]MCB9951720.1 hypothetical protein [Planctomycetaceae bacterium]
MGVVLLILALVCALASFVCAIIILIAAFKEGLAQGLLCLCIPFYVLYFAVAKFQHEKKGLIIAGWIGGAIIANVLSAMAGALAGP